MCVVCVYVGVCGVCGCVCVCVGECVCVCICVCVCGVCVCVGIVWLLLNVIKWMLLSELLVFYEGISVYL